MPELIPAEPLSPDWHAARRLGVTATDIVTVCGLSRWDSAYALYWRKLGQAPEVPDSDRFRLGRELEPYIAERFRAEHVYGFDNIRPGGLWRSSSRSWQLATPDRLLVHEDDSPPLELKSWASADAHSWEAGPPPSVRAQVLWQMDVMDAAAGHVGVVFLPSGEFRSYVIEHEPTYAGSGWGCNGNTCLCCADLRLMLERGLEFWRRLQGELPPPDVDGSAASLAALKARFGDVHKDKTATIDPALHLAWLAAKDLEDDFRAKAKVFEAAIREQVGEAGRIEVGGELVAYHQSYPVKAHWRKESHVDKIVRVRQEEETSE